MTGRILEHPSARPITAGGEGDGPEAVQAERPRADARGTVLAGIAVLVLFFGGAGTWAAWAPLSSAAVAPAFVKVDGNRKTVQHQGGGIIRDILVRNGDVVVQGQTLARLDDTEARASVDVLEAQHDAAAALQARLLAERDEAEALVLDDDIRSRSNEPKVASLIAAQLRLLQERRREITGAIAVLREQGTLLRQQIDGGEAQRDGIHRQRELIESELVGLRQLLVQALVPRSRVLALERTAAALDAEAGRVQAEMAQAQTQIGQTELRTLQLRQERMTEVSDALRDVGSRLADLAPRLHAARATLDRTTIRAPNAGEVVGLAVFTQGGVIGTGDRILDIVPGGGSLLFEARLRPEDANRIAPGMTAEIRLTGIADRRGPILPGRISTISADRLTDQRAPDGYYAVEVLAEPPPAGQGNTPRFRLEPGMPATVTIATEARTALDYLISPLRDRLSTALREE